MRRAATKRTQSQTELRPNISQWIAIADLDWVQNAGSVFVGRWSAQPMGDYISGPNHTLPTGGMARVRGGLSVNDFVKLITVQQYTGEARSLSAARPHCWRKPKVPVMQRPFAPASKEVA